MSNIIPHFQVECAIGWPDRTWSDEHYVYLPEDKLELADALITRAAVEAVEKQLDAAKKDYSFVVHFFTNTEQRFTPAGELIEEEGEPSAPENGPENNCAKCGCPLDRVAEPVVDTTPEGGTWKYCSQHCFETH